jgi:hypothetical protein
VGEGAEVCQIPVLVRCAVSGRLGSKLGRRGDRISSRRDDCDACRCAPPQRAKAFFRDETYAVIWNGGGYQVERIKDGQKMSGTVVNEKLAEAGSCRAVSAKAELMLKLFVARDLC